MKLEYINENQILSRNTTPIKMFNKKFDLCFFFFDRYTQIIEDVGILESWKFGKINDLNAHQYKELDLQVERMQTGPKIELK